MAFGDIESEEPCLHGIGQIVERVLDQKWYWAKILGPGSVTNTINLEYMDDHKVEEDVPLSEVRVGVIPGCQPHLKHHLSRSSSSTITTTTTKTLPSITEIGSGSAGDEALYGDDKTALFVADAVGGLEHSAYVGQASSPGGKAREVATQTADEEDFPTVLFAKRTTIEPRQPAAEAPSSSVEPLADTFSKAVSVKSTSTSSSGDGDDEDVRPPVKESGICAFPNCQEATKYRCARCGESFYCGRTHQKQHWADSHASACKPSDWLLYVKKNPPVSPTSGGGGGGIGAPGSGWHFTPAAPSSSPVRGPFSSSSSSAPVQSQALILLPSSGGSASAPPTGAGADGYVSDVEAEEGGGGSSSSSKRVAWSQVGEEEDASQQSQQQQQEGVEFQPGTGGRPATPIAWNGPEKKGVTFSEDALDRGGGRKRPLAGGDSWTDCGTSFSGFGGGGAAVNLSRRPVSDENLVKLMEMGFGEQQAREALQWYNDDLERACEFLLIGGGTDSSTFMDISDGGLVYGPQTSDDFCKTLFDDDMKTQAGDDIDMHADDLDAVKFSNEASVRVGGYSESHQVTVDVYGFHDRDDMESQRPYALRFVFKDRDCPQVLDIPGRDVVIGVNTYKDKALLLAEREEELIRTVLHEITANWDGSRWAYTLRFPGRVVASSRAYNPHTSAA